MNKIFRITALCLAVLLTVLLSSFTASAAKGPRFSVTVSGETVTGLQVLRIDSTAYVPFEAFCNALGGGKVTREADTGRIVYTDGGLKIRAACGNKYMEISGRPIPCQTGIRNIDSLVYVPLLPMAEAFGAEVRWDPFFRVHLTVEEPSYADDYDEEDLYWLSRIISAESKGESLEGKIAVGNVVLNRVAHKDFPDTVKEVIFEEGQFTPVKNGSLYDEPTDESIRAAKLCLDGEVVTADALYFCNPAIATGTWIQKNCTYCMTVGNHAFYK